MSDAVQMTASIVGDRRRVRNQPARLRDHEDADPTTRLCPRCQSAGKPRRLTREEFTRTRPGNPSEHIVRWRCTRTDWVGSTDKPCGWFEDEGEAEDVLAEREARMDARQAERRTIAARGGQARKAQRERTAAEKPLPPADETKEQRFARLAAEVRGGTYRFPSDEQLAEAMLRRAAERPCRAANRPAHLLLQMPPPPPASPPSQDRPGALDVGAPRAEEGVSGSLGSPDQNTPRHEAISSPEPIPTEEAPAMSRPVYDRQAIREGLLAGKTYAQIAAATGASDPLIAKVSRELKAEGLLLEIRKRPGKAPTSTPPAPVAGEVDEDDEDYPEEAGEDQAAIVASRSLRERALAGDGVTVQAEAAVVDVPRKDDGDIREILHAADEYRACLRAQAEAIGVAEERTVGPAPGVVAARWLDAKPDEPSAKPPHEVEEWLATLGRLPSLATLEERVTCALRELEERLLERAGAVRAVREALAGWA